MDFECLVYGAQGAHRRGDVLVGPVGGEELVRLGEGKSQREEGDDEEEQGRAQELRRWERGQGQGLDFRV